MSDLLDSSAQVAMALSGGSLPAAALVSPSLFGPTGEVDSATAYEVKFLLTEEQVREIVHRVDGKLSLDPFADAMLGNAYLTTSIYTDTPNFDVYHRAEGHKRDKFRLRRYGVNGPVFVEQKTKNGEKVRKHRSKIDRREVGDLAASQLNGEWAGEWFHSRLIEKQLRPVCHVAYMRVAYLGLIEGGTVRLTFDRNIRGMLAEKWELETVAEAAPLLSNLIVCEFKFRNVMPALLRGIVADLNLAPSPFSKYRNFMQSTGLVSPLPAKEMGPEQEAC
jgi:hypothetical protein